MRAPVGEKATNGRARCRRRCASAAARPLRAEHDRLARAPPRADDRALAVARHARSRRPGGRARNVRATRSAAGVDDRHASARRVGDVHARAAGCDRHANGVRPTAATSATRSATRSTTASLRAPLITYARAPSGDSAIAAGRCGVAISPAIGAGGEVDDRHAAPRGRPRSRRRARRRPRARPRARRPARGTCATIARVCEVDHAQAPGRAVARDDVGAQAVEGQRDGPRSAGRRRAAPRPSCGRGPRSRPSTCRS